MQKKVGDVLYVFDTVPFVITEDIDSEVIYVQHECINGYKELNTELASKIKGFNQFIISTNPKPWAKPDPVSPELAWSSDSATAVVGETNTYPTLTNTDNVEVTYDSSDTSVATIASDGTITLLEAGTTTISAIFAGDDTYNAKTVSYLLTVSEPAHDYSKDYLTTKALSSGEISFSGSGASYRKNNGEWTNYTEPITVMQDDVVEWKGTLTPDSTNGIGTIGSTGDIDAYGNVMSMLFGDNFANQTDLTGKDYAFYALFKGNTRLINAENLILPATSLADHCYYSMFSGCTSLTTAPELPATTLSTYCYSSMFYGCTSLTTAPSLPATILAFGCYFSMFSGCTSLTTAPELPATTLKGNCYMSMFSGCTSLTTAPSLPATTLKSGCYESMFYGCTLLNNVTCLAYWSTQPWSSTRHWLNNVAASGTFTKNATMSNWTTGGDGIPQDWIVQDYSAPAQKRSPELAWSAEEATVIGDSASDIYPTLSNPHNVEVTYESEEATVADIDENGNVSIVGTGDTNINAIFEGDETYEAQTVTYILHVQMESENDEEQPE